MEAFFHSIFGNPYEMGAGQSFASASGGGMYPGAFYQQQWQAAHNMPPERKGAPPASTRAIRQLPTVVVRPEDLVDEHNRECCICFEENHLKDRVIRLPCAHIYHQRCIVEWLLKHCTCPVCRYELPTDDPEYEHTRMERMKYRKPRYAQYELDQMSIHDLRSLATRLRLDQRGITEKRELVEHIVKSGRIDIIATPKPVEYKLSDLRSMGVGKLKRAMESAGVFFDPVDVVEKEDMVQIFVNSGRVVLLPEEKKDKSSTNEGEMTQEVKEDERAVAEKEEGATSGFSEHEMEEDEKDEGKKMETDHEADGMMLENDESLSSQNNSKRKDEHKDKVEHAESSTGTSNEILSDPMDVDDLSHSPPVEDGDSLEATASVEVPLGSAFQLEETMEHNSHDDVGREDSSSNSSTPNIETTQQPHSSSSHSSSAVPTSSPLPEPSAARSQLNFAHRMTVSELRALAGELDVDISDCLEKYEVVQRLVDSAAMA